MEERRLKGVALRLEALSSCGSMSRGGDRFESLDALHGLIGGRSGSISKTLKRVRELRYSAAFPGDEHRGCPKLC